MSTERTSRAAYAPIVRLCSGEYLLHSTCSFVQYAAYRDNLNYAYGRYFPLATVYPLPKEIEGVDWLFEVVAKAKAAYSRSPLALPEDAAARIPSKLEWITIGEHTVDATLFTPYVVTAWGFSLEVRPDRYFDAELLQVASQQAFGLARGFEFILLDLSKPVKIGKSVMPSSWLLEVAEAGALAEGQSVRSGYLVYAFPQEIPERAEDEEVPNLLELVEEQRMLALLAFERLWIRGTIALSPSLVKFAENWELAPESYAGLYHPMWENTLITNGDPTPYLLLAKSVYTGKTLAKGVEKRELASMPVRQAMQYLSSPLINTSYRSALEKAYEFYAVQKSASVSASASEAATAYSGSCMSNCQL